MHKLEKQKMTNELMLMMFTSISHELRTPINAFVNANQMIQFGLDKIKEISDDLLNENGIASLKKMIELIDKNTMIATISSNLLLNLTEDILDFTKIEAGIFSLNPSFFSIDGFINEIHFLFEHQ